MKLVFIPVSKSPSPPDRKFPAWILQECGWTLKNHGRLRVDFSCPKNRVNPSRNWQLGGLQDFAAETRSEPWRTGNSPSNKIPPAPSIQLLTVRHRYVRTLATAWWPSTRLRRQRWLPAVFDEYWSLRREPGGDEQVERAHSTLINAADSPWPGGDANGVGNLWPVNPLIKCGMKLTRKAPPKKYDTWWYQRINFSFWGRSWWCQRRGVGATIHCLSI